MYPSQSPVQVAFAGRHPKQMLHSGSAQRIDQSWGANLALNRFCDHLRSFWERLRKQNPLNRLALP